MSVRLEMLRAARFAPNLLLEAGDRVVGFLRGQFNEDGGGRNRCGESDLYYTVFALEGLLALGADPPVEATTRYLGGFGEGQGLDLVHLACLIRCWADLPAGSLEAATARGMLRRVESHRSADGGFGPTPNGERATVYHCFLALGAYQDLSTELPDREGFGRCLGRLQAKDGAYGNEGGTQVGTTPATAAAATLRRHLGMSVPRGLGDWLMARRHPEGGFLAGPKAPAPDMLSTATALHALAEMEASLAEVREPCLDFVDSLWTGQGFGGHPADELPDSEYTYYGLLALGHLGS